MSEPKRILQLTDLHLFSKKQSKMLGFNSYMSLQSVITKIIDSNEKNILPDLIALTGDISQDYSITSYKLAEKLFQKFSCPIAVIMGNHDYLPALIKTFGNPNSASNKTFLLNNWRILFLDSHYPEHISGFLSKNELDFLKKSLARFPKQNTIIFLHHHILPVGSTWIDKLKVTNYSEFLEIIDEHRNIKAVISGHTHQEYTFSRLGVSYFTTPSTSWQFATLSKSFKLDDLMPGYRWIDLYENGSFKTTVDRINYNETFIPDLSSAGY